MTDLEQWRSKQQREKSYAKELKSEDLNHGEIYKIFTEKKNKSNSQQEIKNPYTRSYMQTYLKRQKETQEEDIYPKYQRIPDFLNEYAPGKRPESPIDYVPQKEREIDKEFLTSNYQMLKTEHSRLIKELQRKQYEDEEEYNQIFTHELDPEESSSDQNLDENSSEELGFTLSKPSNSRLEEVYTETFHEYEEEELSDYEPTYEKILYKRKPETIKKHFSIEREHENNYFTFDKKAESPIKQEKQIQTPREPIIERVTEKQIQTPRETIIERVTEKQKEKPKLSTKSTGSLSINTKSIDIHANTSSQNKPPPQKLTTESRRPDNPGHYGVQIMPVYQYLPQPTIMQYQYP